MEQATLPTLRRSDFTLDEVQKELRRTAAQFFDKHCPTTLVREAEPRSFDEGLWAKVVAMGLTTMSLPADLGGDDATLVELVIVAEAMGRRIAPIPLVEHVVALRAFAATGAYDLVERHRGADRIATFAPLEQGPGSLALVPHGAIAAAVVGLRDGELVVHEIDEPPPLVRSLGGSAIARCALGSHGRDVVLAAGADAALAFRRARLEWQLLVGGALVGLARGALDLTVAYANERMAFGVPIGTFQALSHPLADVLTAIEGTRSLLWRAAWYLQHEPAVAERHVQVAFLRACETAEFATAQGIHTQGGFGFTLESDLHLYFRRAKSWPLVGGDPKAALARIADLEFGPPSGKRVQ